jgi:hypothetical protein
MGRRKIWWSTQVSNRRSLPRLSPVEADPTPSTGCHRGRTPRKEEHRSFLLLVETEAYGIARSPSLSEVVLRLHMDPRRLTRA